MGTPIKTRLRLETFDTYCKVRCINNREHLLQFHNWTELEPPQYVIYIRDGGFPYRAVDNYFQPMITWLHECDIPHTYIQRQLAILLANDHDLSLFKLRWL